MTVLCQLFQEKTPAFLSNAYRPQPGYGYTSNHNPACTSPLTDIRVYIYIYIYIYITDVYSMGSQNNFSHVPRGTPPPPPTYKIFKLRNFRLK